MGRAWMGIWLGFTLTCLGMGETFAQQENLKIAGPYHRLVIRGALLIDGTGAPPVGPVDIVIEKNIITRIIPVDPVSLARGKVQRPMGDRVIEAEGMVVMPGIIDMHAHVSSRVPKEYVYKLWLAHGVTTVRAFSIGDLSPEEMVAEKRRVASDPRTIAPRIFVYPFWRPRGDTPKERARYADPEGARAIVQAWHRMGADGIKMTGKPGLYPDVFRAICSEANRLGMGVAVHIGQDGVVPMNAVEVARAGARTIEHHYGYAEAAFSDRIVQDLPGDYNYADEAARFRYTARVWLETDLEELYGQVLHTLAEISHRTGFAMDPTFAVYEANRDLVRAQNLPWHKRFAMPAIWAFWQPDPRHHASFHFAWTSTDEAVWARMFRRWMEFVNRFKNLGGRVTVGSDPGYLYHLYGFGTIREMEMLQRAGFHALEVIRSATWEGAQALRAERLGVIRPGYRADLIIVNGNPVEDLKVLYGMGVVRVTPDGRMIRTGGVRYTIRDGVVFDAVALLRDVETMVQKAKAPQTALSTS